MTDRQDRRVAVFGAGYIGLVTGANLLDPVRMRELGFTSMSVGRP
ncbi:hypothetical protein [Streptomyces stackebrandtii]|nr:hypothetical protein [Streptomyces sp. DSM 40976]